MDSTTLVTFWFKAPQDARTVELYGSWDNFANGHLMQRDSHKGHGSWTCCPKFKRIICDGVRPDYKKPRSGALKQGGRYWYYFKLDDEEECCDLNRPNTTACPLLPGQVVNILDIPVEMIDPPQRVTSASGSALFAMQAAQMTYDPQDRYKKVQRKPPTKLPRYYCSSDALHEKAAEFNSSIMQSGGAVQPAAQLSPTPQQRVDAAGNRTLKRVRGRPATYQQSDSYHGNTTSAELKALVQSISSTVPDLGSRLPELQPFGPSPHFRSDDRPASRHGSAEGAAAVGLGITLEGHGTFPLPPNTSSLGGPVQSILRRCRRTRRPSTPVDRSNGNDNITDWPYSHPNPLRGNPGSVSPHGSARQAYPSPASSTTSSITPPLVSPLDEAFDYHPGFPGPMRAGAEAGAGLHDLVSPTFTATTVSPLEDCFDLSENEQQYSTPFSSFGSTAQPTFGYPGDFAAYMEAAQSHSSSTTLVALQKETSRVVSSGTQYYDYPDSVVSSPMSLVDDLASDDFANEVFGALGFK